MSKVSYKFICPNCSSELSWKLLLTSDIKIAKTRCPECYYPVTLDTKKQTAEIRVESFKKNAFLIHSSKAKERVLLDWFRHVVSLYGVNTFIIEDDPRSKLDWLQKGLDGINLADFVLVFLTKRYQWTDEKGHVGWKAPDKCYDEIAMSFARYKDILALVENDVDLGGVLETRAWCYRFERDPHFKTDGKFFGFLDKYLRNF